MRAAADRTSLPTGSEAYPDVRGALSRAHRSLVRQTLLPVSSLRLFGLLLVGLVAAMVLVQTGSPSREVVLGAAFGVPGVIVLAYLAIDRSRRPGIEFLLLSRERVQARAASRPPTDRLVSYPERDAAIAGYATTGRLDLVPWQVAADAAPTGTDRERELVNIGLLSAQVAWHEHGDWKAALVAARRSIDPFTITRSTRRLSMLWWLSPVIGWIVVSVILLLLLAAMGVLRAHAPGIDLPLGPGAA